MKNVQERSKGGGTLHAHIWGASREREDAAQIHEAGTCLIIKEPLRGKRSFGAVTGTAWVKALPGRVARPLKTIVRTLTVIGGV